MNVRYFVVAALVVGVVGCGGGDPCSRPSSCANDPVRTQSEITTCRATLDANKNATCFNLVLSFNTCLLDNTVCTSGGTTDGTLTLTKASNNCKSQYDAATSCCAGNPTSTACN